MYLGKCNEMEFYPKLEASSNAKFVENKSPRQRAFRDFMDKLEKIPAQKFGNLTPLSIFVVLICDRRFSAAYRITDICMFQIIIESA